MDSCSREKLRMIAVFFFFLKKERKTERNKEKERKKEKRNKQRDMVRLHSSQ